MRSVRKDQGKGKEREVREGSQSESSELIELRQTVESMAMELAEMKQLILDGFERNSLEIEEVRDLVDYDCDVTEQSDYNVQSADDDSDIDDEAEYLKRQERILKLTDNWWLKEESVKRKELEKEMELEKSKESEKKKQSKKRTKLVERNEEDDEGNEEDEEE
jgi:hypothetical protein